MELYTLAEVKTLLSSMTATKPSATEVEDAHALLQHAGIRAQLRAALMLELNGTTAGAM